jgi:hypothetical protein
LWSRVHGLGSERGDGAHQPMVWRVEGNGVEWSEGVGKYGYGGCEEYGGCDEYGGCGAWRVGEVRED